MTQKSSKTKQSRSIKNITRRRPAKWQIILILIGMSLLGFVGYATYNHLSERAAIAAEKERFEKVRKSVEKLSNQLQTASEPEVKWKFSTGCSEGHAKYAQGLISCESHTIAYVEVTSAEDARTSITNYNAVIDNNSSFLLTKSYSASTLSSSFPNPPEAGLGSAVYKHTATSMSCAVAYTIPNELERQNRQADPSKILMRSYFYCRDRAKVLHF